jgi:ubiquinone/menaquinone biosynthesis C-methylase UbiE
MNLRSNMLLENTYRDPEIHNNWRRVYHANKAQSRFDDAVYDWLFVTLQPRGRWLDAGCGPGEHSVRIARSTGADVLAIDISSVALNLASKTVRSQALDRQISLERYALEELPTTLKVDHVHSRGVLMHIPKWRSALGSLCRCIRDGGYLVLFENNRSSLEMLVVRAIRCVRHCHSQMVHADGGVEFWSEESGKPFVVRATSIDALVTAMKSHGIELVLRRTASLFDIYRIPSIMRPAVIALNRIWFRWNLPFGSGVILVGKRSSSAPTNRRRKERDAI